LQEAAAGRRSVLEEDPMEIPRHDSAARDGVRLAIARADGALATREADLGDALAGPHRPAGSA
jgi:hypothetical protein